GRPALSFEPGAEPQRRLRRNTDANGLGDRVTIHPYATSNRRGVARLQCANILAQRSLFANEFTADTGLETVECVSLSDAVEACGAGRIDLLKMDVEGSEIEAVEGTDPETWDRIDRVAFEDHDHFRPGCRERGIGVL